MVNNSDKKSKPKTEEIATSSSLNTIESQQKRTKVEQPFSTSNPTTIPSSTKMQPPPTSMSTLSNVPKSLSSLNGQTFIEEEEDDDDASDSDSEDDDE